MNDQPSDLKPIRQWIDARDKIHSGATLSEKNGFQVIDCQHCGFVHAVPIPDDEQLKDFYSKRYYQDAKPDYAKQHAGDKDWWNLVYRERYERFEQYLRRKGSILDVGSGPGFFLSTGARLGWTVTGIEPSEAASEYSRQLGVNCITSSFDAESIKTLGTYDVIQINQAIEHIPNPKLIIDICNTLLAKDGLICIIAANDFNPLQKIARDVHGLPDWWVVPPEHLNYFTIESLSTLISRCGFEVVNRTATFPIDIFLLMGENYVSDDSIGKECHRRRKCLEFAFEEHGGGYSREGFTKALPQMAWEGRLK